MTPRTQEARSTEQDGKMGDAVPARAASLRPQPAAQSSQSGITIAEAVINYHIAFSRARRFGLRCEAKMPPLDGEQSRQATEFNSEQYWQGLATREERDAAVDEIERASRSYWTKGKVAYLGENGGGKARRRLRRAIIERDGADCWLCGNEMPMQDRTVEHLIAKSNGGTDELDNLALCHEACNVLLGNLPLAAKLDLRRKYRDEAA